MNNLRFFWYSTTEAFHSDGHYVTAIVFMDGPPLGQECLFLFKNGGIKKGFLSAPTNVEKTLIEILEWCDICPNFKEILRELENKNSVKINEEYTARINKGYIEVGCQKIPNGIVREIFTKLID